ncbi:MAG: hypothetical protein PVSMB2_14770 [Ktedonobacteraceae bacterium]
MALYEDHDNHAKKYWQDRLARERLNISESVEETLADTSSQELWSDDEQQYVSADRSLSSSIELIPPRLSLQSKVQPAVHPASFVQSVTAEIAAQQAATQAKEECRKSQGTNILTRFAQRFTSSIAAIMQPDIPTWSSTRSEYAEALPQERQLAPLPPTYVVAPLESAPTVIDAIPATPALTSSHPVRSKQRLAGHTAKVRLQTAPLPKETPYPKERDIYGWSQETKEPLREPLTLNVRFREKVQEASSTAPLSKPAPRNQIQKQHESQAKTGVTPSNTDCTSFFGTGAFERGQGELMVRNTHTVATSVVHITLTSNPGPTLVQYISLHPAVGFTLHLTAPATMKTTFNYMLFIDTSTTSL